MEAQRGEEACPRSHSRVETGATQPSRPGVEAARWCLFRGLSDGSADFPVSALVTAVLQVQGS